MFCVDMLNISSKKFEIHGPNPTRKARRESNSVFNDCAKLDTIALKLSKIGTESYRQGQEVSMECVLHLKLQKIG